jgi:hypothetical protein
MENLISTGCPVHTPYNLFTNLGQSPEIAQPPPSDWPEQGYVNVPRLTQKYYKGKASTKV